MWNFNRLQHARIHVLNGFRLPQPTKQQTNPHESQNLLSSHSRLLRKLRDTLTFMHCETIAVWPQCRGKLRGGKQTRIHRRAWYNDINLNPSMVKSCSKQNIKRRAWTCHDSLTLLHLPQSTFHPASPWEARCNKLRHWFERCHLT